MSGTGTKFFQIYKIWVHKKRKLTIIITSESHLIEINQQMFVKTLVQVAKFLNMKVKRYFWIFKAVGPKIFFLACHSVAYFHKLHHSYQQNFCKSDRGHSVVYIMTSSNLNYWSNTTKVPLHRMLTFRNLAAYIQDGRKIILQMSRFIFIQQISVLNILNMLYNLHIYHFKMPYIS